MNTEPFKPENFGFILRSDYKPPRFPDHYERNSSEHEIGPDEDWGRINVYLTKDDDFICIWYGVLDPVEADILCQKWYGFDWPDSGDFQELFRGYISSKFEAEVILKALRLDKYRVELNLGMLPPDDSSFNK